VACDGGLHLTRLLANSSQKVVVRAERKSSELQIGHDGAKGKDAIWSRCLSLFRATSVAQWQERSMSGFAFRASAAGLSEAHQDTTTVNAPKPSKYGKSRRIH
jgi:propanediol dehydratase large subunit